ncbi:hypothetical protein GGF37_001191 [Kickxella alabastrina]|nr:hypothetical protein GGF37_001191 [Kickxella alabastrina]
MSHSFVISHKGTKREFDIDNTTTLGQLRGQIRDVFGVDPSNQKLFRGGLINNDQETPVASIIPHKSRVVLMGTVTGELEHLHAREALRQTAQQNHERYKATLSDIWRTPTMGSLSRDNMQHTFHAFEALELPEKQRALDILHKLSKDEGVRQIMVTRQYSVGTLRELHPFERTILGYNRNRGEVIALRLRTDDLEGFRRYESVRDVLMHELAHMVWDEHDERFHRLNRELCKEVVELNWQLRGQRVGGQAPRVYEPPRPEDAELVDGGSLGSAGFVLGGKAPSQGEEDGQNSSPDSHRDLAYKAWEKRSRKN